MLRRFAHLLIAFVVALAAAMPAGARPMPMAADAVGTAVHHGCQTCPHDPTGKLPACPILACASAAAVLPAPALLPERILLRAAYLMARPVRWTAAAHAPDPFPPRSVALV